MGRLFGTDGVRGRANEALTAELALDLSVAAAHVLGEAGAFSGHVPTAVVGRDPRASGEFLEAAVVAGLASAGVNVVRLGVLPTPGVAYPDRTTPDADLGVMLSASHNPMPDNGIKFFARGGPQARRRRSRTRIEARMGEVWDRPTGAAVGRVRRRTQALVEPTSPTCWPASVSRTASTGSRSWWTARNGRGQRRLARAFARAGAEVVAIHAEPDGLNINDDCGSTHLEHLQDAVVAHGADLGIALDGDADRCLAVDADGALVDGDQIMAILALALRDRGRLTHDTLVATVMSNLGLLLAMEAEGIRGACRPRSATGTCWRRCGRAATASAASSPVTSSWPSTRRPATAC